MQTDRFEPVHIAAGLAAMLALVACAGAPPAEPETVQGPTKTVEMRPMRMSTGGCAATLQVDWYQSDTDVHVRATVANESCAASHGSYSLRVRVRNDAGETSSLDFEEDWRRGGSEPVVSERDYPVGSGVTVTRVSGRRLRCRCDDEGG